MARRLVPCNLMRGQVVYEPGQRPDGVWIIGRGCIELAISVGRSTVVAAALRRGDVFGDLPLLTEHGHPYMPRALIRTTCLVLPETALNTLLDQHPAITRLWLAGVALRLTRSQARLPGTLCGPLPRRAAWLLLNESSDGSVNLTQNTLAGMLGAARPSLNRVLRELEEARLISLRYREVRLLDVDGLSALADPAPGPVMTRQENDGADQGVDVPASVGDGSPVV